MPDGPAQGEPAPRKVSVFVDPACPWTWITAQWLREVAPHRNLHLHWRSLSLQLRDGDELPQAIPAQFRAAAAAARTESHRLLRVFEALRASAQEAHIDGLYRLWGERVFGPSRSPQPSRPGLTGEIVASAGLPDTWAASADDPAWDAAITAAMNEATQAAGHSLSSPTIVLDTVPAVGFTGPVFSTAPTGRAALRAWDAVNSQLTEPGFIELSRPRTALVMAQA